MKNLKFWTLLLSATFILFTSCKDDDDKDKNGPTPTNGTLGIKFDHRWGPMGNAFSMNTPHIHPATQEEITFTTLRYYISNVILHKDNGEQWIEPESYRIVTVGNNSSIVTLNVDNIPPGDYNAITFTVGVDAPRNSSGAQTGALSPSEGMFWSWTTGYIFIKAEGMSPAAPNGQFMYHIGGFEDPNNAIRTTRLEFGDNLRIEGSRTPNLHLMINTARFWHGGISISDVFSIHMPGQNANRKADNFIDAIQFDHFHR